jgi:amino-acid N-acetyltransferase
MATPAEVSLRPAVGEDVPIILALLQAYHLPGNELEDHIGNFVVAEAEGRVVACGGVEVYDSATSGLIRSMAVEEGLRGSGVGRLVLEWVIAKAAERGLDEVFLFTMNAHPFYEHFGFRHCTIKDFPKEARRSAQYRFVRSNGSEWGISPMVRAVRPEGTRP